MELHNSGYFESFSSPVKPNQKNSIKKQFVNIYIEDNVAKKDGQDSIVLIVNQPEVPGTKSLGVEAHANSEHLFLSR